MMNDRQHTPATIFDATDLSQAHFGRCRILNGLLFFTFYKKLLGSFMSTLPALSTCSFIIAFTSSEAPFPAEEKQPQKVCPQRTLLEVCCCFGDVKRCVCAKRTFCNHWMAKKFNRGFAGP